MDLMTRKQRPVIDYADTAYREAVSRLRTLLAEGYASPSSVRSIGRPSHLHHHHHYLHNELDSAGEEIDNRSASGGSVLNRKPSPQRSLNYNVVPRAPTTFNRLRNFDDSTSAHLSTPILSRRERPPIEQTSFNRDDTDRIAANRETNVNDAAPPPPSTELMSFIERQEDYIEQLERESRFCKDELSTLLSKVKEVITENEYLHDKQKTNLIDSIYDGRKRFDETDDETTETLDDADDKCPTKPYSSAMTRTKKRSAHRHLAGPSIVFESRISELEAQLTQTRIDLKKAHDELDKRRAQGDADAVDGFDTYRKQIETLQREKSLAQENVAKMQSQLNQMRDKEYSASDQMKRTIDVAEQAQYEKSAAEVEIRRLKEELERQHGKLREAIAEQSRRVVEERGTVERRFAQQMEQLQNDLAVQWESNGKLQLELDKQRRENAEQRRELAQKHALIDDMRREMQNKISALQSDIGVTAAEKSAVEQQISTLQMANERVDRQNKQEIARLQVELQSLRQRLDRADADLIHSRRENVRLNDEIATLEKQINLNAALNDAKNKRNEAAPVPLPAPASPSKDGKELTSLVDEMESKHGAERTSRLNDESDSQSVNHRPTKRKEPIKIDVSVKVVPKMKKGRNTGTTQ